MNTVSLCADYGFSIYFHNFPASRLSQDLIYKNVQTRHAVRSKLSLSDCELPACGKSLNLKYLWHQADTILRSQIALLLLENGADPNATDKLQSTPLHRASAKGNYRLIQLLLKQSASTNIQDSQGNTPL